METQVSPHFVHRPPMAGQQFQLPFQFFHEPQKLTLCHLPGLECHRNRFDSYFRPKPQPTSYQFYPRAPVKRIWPPGMPLPFYKNTQMLRSRAFGITRCRQ